MQRLGPAKSLGEALPSALILPMGNVLAKGLLEPIRKLENAARTPAGRAVLVYLLVAPAAQVVLTVVGSLSEYRFPHPILTTELHLSISLIALVALSLSAKAILHLMLLQTRSTPDPRTSATSSAFIPLLSSLASHAPTSLFPLTSHSLFVPLLASLAALVEMHAARVTEAPFWQLARLLPIPLAVSLAGGGPRLLAMLVWGVMMAGSSVGLQGSSEGWFCVAAWAALVTSWVTSARKGLDEAHEGQAQASSGPTMIGHLAFSALLLLPPLLLSGEIAAAKSSGHFGYFTEAGFWLQEVVIALSGLASLGAFWGLLENLDTPAIFVVSALKDFVLPQLFHLLFSNPLPRQEVTGAMLSIRQQWVALAAIGVLKDMFCRAPRKQVKAP